MAVSLTCSASACMDVGSHASQRGSFSSSAAGRLLPALLRVASGAVAAFSWRSTSMAPRVDQRGWSPSFVPCCVVLARALPCPSVGPFSFSRPRGGCGRMSCAVLASCLWEFRVLVLRGRSGVILVVASAPRAADRRCSGQLSYYYDGCLGLGSEWDACAFARGVRPCSG